jgi:hypothetical protein
MSLAMSRKTEIRWDTSAYADDVKLLQDNRFQKEKHFNSC